VLFEKEEDRYLSVWGVNKCPLHCRLYVGMIKLCQLFACIVEILRHFSYVEVVMYKIIITSTIQ